MIKKIIAIPYACLLILVILIACAKENIIYCLSLLKKNRRNKCYTNK